MNDERPKLGLYIDMDGHGVSLAGFAIRSLESCCWDVHIRKAYCNHGIPKAANAIKSLAIDMKQVPTGKNEADKALVADIEKNLRTGISDAFAIVALDKYYSDIVKQIQNTGKRCFVYGTSHTAKILVKAAGPDFILISPTVGTHSTCYLHPPDQLLCLAPTKPDNSYLRDLICEDARSGSQVTIHSLCKANSIHKGNVFQKSHRGFLNMKTKVEALGDFGLVPLIKHGECKDYKLQLRKIMPAKPMEWFAPAGKPSRTTPQIESSETSQVSLNGRHDPPQINNQTRYLLQCCYLDMVAKVTEVQTIHMGQALHGCGKKPRDFGVRNMKNLLNAAGNFILQPTVIRGGGIEYRITLKYVVAEPSSPLLPQAQPESISRHLRAAANPSLSSATIQAPVLSGVNIKSEPSRAYPLRPRPERWLWRIAQCSLVLLAAYFVFHPCRRRGLRQ